MIITPSKTESTGRGALVALVVEGMRVAVFMGFVGGPEG
jgi:hypothetical protein